MKTYGSHFTLEVWITELEISLKDKDKHLQDAFYVATENTRQVEEDQKTLYLEVDAHIKELKTLKDEVVILKVTITSN